MWGVGITTSISDGAIAQITSKISSCLLSTNTPSKLASDYEAYLNQIIGLSPNSMYSQSFNEQVYSTTIYALGGNSEGLLEPSSFPNVLNSIILFLLITNFSLVGKYNFK